MNPWILVSLVAIAVAGIGTAVVARRTVNAGPRNDDQFVRPMSDRKIIVFAISLILSAVITNVFVDSGMWFIPIVVYLTLWMPQVSRRAVAPRQAITVSALFAIAMIVSVVFRVVVLTD